MSKFIQNLKEKPEAYRKRVAVLFSGAAAVLVFCVFLLVFFSNFHEYSEAKSKEPKTESTFSKMSKSYNDYKNNFEDTPLAREMENASFVLHDTSSSTASSTATSTVPVASSTPQASSTNPSGPVGKAPNNTTKNAANATTGINR